MKRMSAISSYFFKNILKWVNLTNFNFVANLAYPAYGYGGGGYGGGYGYSYGHSYGHGGGFYGWNIENLIS